ncbi:hypothetical protein AURANDRAFT_13263, partial [Aureococcus anophagefferens]
TIKLAGGLEMPANGLGTCCRKTAKGPPIVAATKAYLELGGRLLDTAMAYGNHADIGRGLRESGVPRDEVWITSKISPSRAANYKQCAKATADLLEELGVAFVDLLLIHTPKLGEEKTVELWRCLVDAKARGQVRAIGVSNFNGPEIDALEKATGVQPEVNQIQYHPWSSKEWHATVAALKARGVVTTAYNSLGGSRFPGSHGDALATLAAAHGATVPQLLLRWALQKGCAVIPGSSTPAHIAENLAAPAFALSADEMRRIED